MDFRLVIFFPLPYHKSCRKIDLKQFCEYFIDTILGASCEGGEPPCMDGLECIFHNILTCQPKVAVEVEEVTKSKCPAGWIPLANTCHKEGDDQDVLCVTIGAPLKVCKLMNLYKTLSCLIR